jgi:hypothetical protein
MNDEGSLILSELSQDKQLDILRWLLGAQEGQWLLRTAAAYGAVESLKLYAKVRSAQAKAEIKAMLALYGKTKAENLYDAAQILENYLKTVYDQRGWQGTFKPTATEANNNGTARIEIEVSRFVPLENAKKIGQTAPEALALMCDSLWGGWFEALLPDAELHVSSQIAGTNGRTTDLFIVSAYDPSLVMTMPIATPMYPPATPIETPPAPATSPIAELLQIPLEQLAPPQPAPIADPYGMYPPSNPSQPAPPPSNEAARPVSRLQQAMQKKQGDTAPAPVPSAPPKPAVDPLTLPQPVAPDTKPVASQALFMTDMEQKARDSVDRSKRKNPQIMQKLFLSKQARELLSESAENPEPEEISIAGGIETILQKLIAQELIAKPGSITVGVHIMTLPSGGIQIRVGDRVYEAVSDVPPGRIRELLQQAVAQFNEQF